ncbi:Mth938-like domain-containing protein [Neisseria sp.]|uniref:Mth938-like domain-containing protein n=1 Tax=Neisseria sp. TaxID=192066 RepID=UPI0035A0878F
MKIEETTVENAVTVTAYGSGKIEAGGETYTEAVILCGSHAEAFGGKRLSELGAEDFFQTASKLGEPLPEIIIVGTGEKQLFLHPKTVAALAERGIGLESMSTPAACRTLILLQSEGRRVWAWLWA